HISEALQRRRGRQQRRISPVVQPHHEQLRDEIPDRDDGDEPADVHGCLAGEPEGHEHVREHRQADGEGDQGELRSAGPPPFGLRHHGPLPVPRRSSRIWFTRSSASCRLLMFEVMPSRRSPYAGSRSTLGAERSVTSATCDRWNPATVDGIPLKTATRPSSSPTYHCRSTYARNARIAPTTTTATSTTHRATRPRRRRGRRWPSPS